MSYAEYLRGKAAAAPVVLNTRKPTDSSMHTTKVRQMASVIIPIGGDFIGSMMASNDRPYYDNHAAGSFSKNIGKPGDSSAFTSFRGGNAVRECDTNPKPTYVTILGCSSGSCRPTNPSSYYGAGNTSVGRIRSSTTVPSDGSDYMRQKLACLAATIPIPHALGKPAGPVFVDNTVTLSGYNKGTNVLSVSGTSCATTCLTANHSVKQYNKFEPIYNPNPPSQANGQLAVLGVPNATDTRGIYKAGAALRNIPHVPAHHGNDLNVNPDQAFVKYQGNGPAVLKINTPNF